MKLEDQVVSLELSKRLKELGVTQESLFVWFHRFRHKPWMVVMPSTKHAYPPDAFDWCSAFTVAELGELLPVLGGATPLIQKLPTKWTVTYIADNDGHMIRADDALFQDNTEADGRAKMLIYLIETGALPQKGTMNAEATR